MIMEAKPTPSATWRWTTMLLKYGAGIVVAVVAAYGARQEKAREALEKLRAAYEEQTRQTTALQKAVSVFEVEQRDILSKCRSETDTLRQNLLFFLLGAQGAPSKKSSGVGGALAPLLKPKSKPQPRALTKFPRQTPFDDLEVKAK